MTSVLNVGVMPQNPVGNQIRGLQAQVDTLRKDNQMLLLALEAKAPEAFAEYVRLKDEATERADAANRPQQPQFNQFQQQQNRPVFQPSTPNRGGTAGGRF
jgi:hypothetical protein